jgi:hypothetical protein
MRPVSVMGAGMAHIMHGADPGAQAGAGYPPAGTGRRDRTLTFGDRHRRHLAER